MSHSPEIIHSQEIQNRIPHRFENILIDEVILHPEKTPFQADFNLKIPPQDTLNRHIFFTQTIAKKQLLPSSILMEILALASICMYDPGANKQTAFFASITNFKRHKQYEAGELLEGTTFHTKQKGRFFKNSGQLFTHKTQPLAEGEVTAVFMDKTETTPNETASPVDSINSHPFTIPIEKSNWNRHSQLVMADRICDVDSTQILTEYTFPKDHFLTRGHFPGLPVMMGVLQWQAVCDACAAYAIYHKKEGSHRFSCDGEITKADGTPVCDISQMEVEVMLNNSQVMADIITTQKVGFRAMVTPGERLYIRAKNIVS